MLTKLLLISLDISDLVRARTALIKSQIYPFLNQLLRQFESNHSLTKAQHLSVVREHAALNGVWVMSGDCPDTSDFVGSNSDSETGTTDQESSICL
jgi:hypothetical protein